MRTMVKDSSASRHADKTASYPLLETSPRSVLRAACIAAATILEAAASLLIGVAINVLAAGGTGEAFTYVLAGVGVSVLAAGGLILAEWVPTLTGTETGLDAAKSVVRQIIRLPQRLFGRNDRGYYINLVTNSCKTYGSMYGRINVSLVGSLICVAALLLVAALVHPVLAVIMAVYVPLFLLALLPPARRLASLQREGIPTQDAFLGESKYSVENKRSIEAMFAQEYFLRRYRACSEDYFAFIKHYKFNEELVSNLPSILSPLLQVALMGASIILCVAGEAEAGDVFVAYVLGSLVQGPLTSVLQSITYVRANVVHQERLEALARDAAEPSGFGGLYRGAGEGVALRLGRTSLWASAQAREAGEPPLFTSEPFVVPAGSLVVVRGANGAGKSSLLDYLRGLSDPACLEGEAAADPSLARAPYLTYPVPLVPGTLEDNMLGAEPDPGAAAALGVGALAGREVDAGRGGLSFGERQKVGLLRALSARSGALLLDEPLQNLDEGARASLCAWLAGEGRRGRTVVCVMHSGDLDGAADAVLEIRDGRLERVK